MPRQALLATVFLFGCVHNASDRPLPPLLTSAQRSVGRCDRPAPMGLVRSPEALADSLGDACQLDSRVADLDWSRWSIVVVPAGHRVQVRGVNAIAVTDYEPQCGGEQQPVPDPDLGPASYHIVPQRVEGVRSHTRGRWKRCSRSSRRGPEPM